MITGTEKGIDSLGPVNQSGWLAHYIVFEMWPDGSIHPLHYLPVDLGATLDTLDDRDLAGQLHQPGRDVQVLAVLLKTFDGKTVYQNTIQVPLWLRGEFHAGEPSSSGASIDAHISPLERPTFVVRVPAVAHTSLVISDSRFRNLATFDLDQLIQDTPNIRLAEPARLPRDLSASFSENRVDILFLSEGYTETQGSIFLSDVTRIAGDFFDISPLAEYANFVITHTLFITSVQAGADHPPYLESCQDVSCCADQAMSSDPLQGTFVDTAFDARYCTNNIHRLLTVNYAKVLAAAAALPEWDEIIVVVNDRTYGGAGGSFSVVSTHSSATRIAQHEYGHSFVALADEYETPFPGYPSCSDLIGPPCEVNVTDIVTRSLIKWSPWISSATPIPTEPETDPAFAGIVGLFEGARYQPAGMYRSGQSCIMRTLGAPFCQVAGQAYVLKLYEGGWGVPSTGIDLIEPGSAVPEETVISLWYPESRSFEAEILQPAGNPPVDIRWTVDGIQDQSAPTGTFTYTPVVSDVGRGQQIQLSVRDTTSLVHPAMAGTSLESSRLWTVFVNAAPSGLNIEGPAAGAVLSSFPFTARVNPTATLPITYIWQASAQAPVLATDGLSNTAAFTWFNPGLQTITVTAINPGGVVTATAAVTIDEAIAGLSAANNGPTTLGAVTMLSATTVSGTNVVYEWDFGDGFNGSGPLIDHAYGQAGLFTATVTATNAAGSEKTSTIVAIVDQAISGLVASNDGPTRLGASTTLSVSASFGTNVTYDWDFGDGSTASGAVVSHIYSETGRYTATVTAINSVSQVAASTAVTIGPNTWFLYFPLVHALAETSTEATR